LAGLTVSMKVGMMVALLVTKMVEMMDNRKVVTTG
jgi:hypothetical protein